MKTAILILTMFLSCFTGGRGCSVDAGLPSAAGTILSYSEPDSDYNSPESNSLGILPAGTCSIFDGNGNYTSAVRSSHSGRSIQPSNKSPFRTGKAGEPVDRVCYFTFRTKLMRFASGPRSLGRYIHLICRLLI